LVDLRELEGLDDQLGALGHGGSLHGPGTKRRDYTVDGGDSPRASFRARRDYEDGEL
jgi:hypothetical protein